MNPFKQITTFLESSNWFWTTLCQIFQLFSCSVFLFIYICIYIYSIFNGLLNVYQQGYVICNLFFLIFFIFIVYIIFIEKKKTFIIVLVHQNWGFRLHIQFSEKVLRLNLFCFLYLKISIPFFKRLPITSATHKVLEIK